LLALVGTRLHEAAESAARRAAILSDIHNVLKLQVIQKETVHRAVAPPGEVLAKAITVETAQPRLSFECTAHEAHFAVGGEQVHHFIVQTFVEIVAIGVLQLPDHLHVIEPPNLVLELLDPLRQRAQINGSGHVGTSFFRWIGYSMRRIDAKKDGKATPLQPVTPAAPATCVLRPRKRGLPGRCWICTGRPSRKARWMTRGSRACGASISAARARAPRPSSSA